jgi:hypothetical protein
MNDNGAATRENLEKALEIRNKRNPLRNIFYKHKQDLKNSKRTRSLLDDDDDERDSDESYERKQKMRRLTNLQNWRFRYHRVGKSVNNPLFRRMLWFNEKK